MRIGLVSPYSWTVPGGVNDHVANLAVQLERRGHEVWILAPSGDASTHAGAPPVPKRFISMGQTLSLRSNGSRAHVKTSLLLLPRMERTLGELELDVLHAHEPCTPVSGAAVLRATCPTVGTFHAALDGSLWYDMLFPLARKVIDTLAVKIAVSQAALDYPGNRFPGVYRIIPNGVNVAEFVPARGREKVPGRILFVGRAEPRKGVDVLLHAFALLRRDLPLASLVLAGVRWDEVINLAPRPTNGLRWPLAGIDALGWVSHDEKIDEMAAAEVLCVPSVEGESFGIVLAEGMAAGLPVVASDLPGYRAVLGDGDYGVLVPPRDPQALADALLRVLASAEWRARLGEHAAAAVEEFDWEHVADQVLETYEEALEQAAVR
ncbi:MAG: glycosyltransferase family 4 protein [Thermoleophilia bacterium]